MENKLSNIKGILVDYTNATQHTLRAAKRVFSELPPNTSLEVIRRMVDKGNFGLRAENEEARNNKVLRIARQIQATLCA